MKRKNYIVTGPLTAPTQEIGDLIHDAVNWFLAKYNMQDVGNRFGHREHVETVRITVNTATMKDLDCYGQCYEWDADPSKCNYVIDVACDQGLRDLLATVFHECVHLWQWERNHWKGYGEKEANDLQYELADEYWRSGNVLTNTGSLGMSDMTREEATDMTREEAIKKARENYMNLYWDQECFLNNLYRECRELEEGDLDEWKIDG